jgi:hypothetical protein
MIEIEVQVRSTSTAVLLDKLQTSFSEQEKDMQL